MRAFVVSGLLLLTVPGAAAAQQPDSTARRDSVARADSAAIADSISVMRDLGRIRGEPRAGAPTDPAPATNPANPRLLPDISAVGDFIADVSPNGSTQEEGERFGVREVEVALQAAVDPYFRGDVFIGFGDHGAAVEQAFLTATALPLALEARLGRFLMPFGKQNLTHRHDLHTLEHSYVVQRFFGEEGLRGTGLWMSRVFAPLGFYQELQLTAVNQFGEGHGHEDEPEPVTAEAANATLAGLGYSARVRNYWDLTPAANLEVSASAVTGRRPQPLAEELPGGINAVNLRQTVVGGDVTFRWRPPGRALYKSLIVQAEVMRQLNERGEPAYTETDPVTGAPVTAAYAGPTRDYLGAYAFARYQLTRRVHVGARVDHLEDPEKEGEILRAASGYLTFYPSEFSKLVLGYERRLPSAAYRALMSPEELDARDRIVLQATFAIGPHKPHPF